MSETTLSQLISPLAVGSELVGGFTVAELDGEERQIVLLGAGGRRLEVMVRPSSEAAGWSMKTRSYALACA